jgi:hypothetical protein
MSYLENGMIVTVKIADKDRVLGAMVKAIAREIAGIRAVKGTTKEVLATKGAYDFEFASDEQGVGFRKLIHEYLPMIARRDIVAR